MLYCVFDPGGGLGLSQKSPASDLGGNRPLKEIVWMPLVKSAFLGQGFFKDTFCSFEAWLFPPQYMETTIYKAMFRCIMQGSLLDRSPEKGRLGKPVTSGCEECAFLSGHRRRMFSPILPVLWPTPLQEEGENNVS